MTYVISSIAASRLIFRM